ncbi:16771_t:CDS:2, partial [Acaulospora colombiana]
ELPKKANQVLVTKDGNTILVADKFGDAPKSDRAEATPKYALNTLEGRKSTNSHPNPSQGNLVLGHTSSLTAMSLTLDEKFILTADRDEHIRLPNHTPGILISGGGDRNIFFWDYLAGTVLNQISIWDVVYPSMKVFSQRRKFQKLEAKVGTGWRARKRKEKEAREERERLEREGRKKAKMEGSVSTPDENASRNNQDATGSEIGDPSTARIPPGELQKDEKQEDGEEGDMMAVDTVQGGMAVSRQRSQLPSLDDVIVISKIETLQFGLEYLLVFTAVG